MEKLPNLKEQLSGFSDRRLTELTAELDTLDDIGGDIAAAICRVFCGGSPCRR